MAVFHSAEGLWRVVDADYLADTGDKGSWNLSEVPAFATCAEALSSADPGVFL